MNSNAAHTLLNAEALAFAAQVWHAQRSLVKDKSYRATPVGGEVGRFLRALRWEESSQNTLDTYEIVLARLAYDHAHFQGLAEFTTEGLRDFLDAHWGEAASATRRNRLAIVRSFFAWAVKERGLGESPAARIKAPRQGSVDRHAYSPALLEQLRRGQPSLRDQICVQLLALLGLRKNELRLLRLRDFDLGKGSFLVHAKGGGVAMMPIAFPGLRSDLELYLIGRDQDEYLLYPRSHPERPMDQASVHRWLKTCLKRAGLPTSIKTHELRHSAADNLWRETGNLLLAQQLLRHKSVATTQAYLHPNSDDLSDALANMQVVRSDDQETA
jgi:integrase/recombinase XerD